MFMYTFVCFFLVPFGKLRRKNGRDSIPPLHGLKIVLRAFMVSLSLYLFLSLSVSLLIDLLS